MTHAELKTIFAIGETIGVEFKRCGNGIDDDTYETVCSFSNRFGGDIFLGVENNGKVRGVPEKSMHDLVKNFINMVNNPNIISPTVYLTPEIIEYEGKQIIHIHIPSSAEVHSFKKVIYDRMGDSDVKVKSTVQIAQLYIRKHKIFTEKRVFPYVKDEDLRLDMLPRIRKMATIRDGKHPWGLMTDKEILQSAGFIGEDPETGKRGYNLAAIMLLGRDEIILDASPVYRTDALVRRINTDRYDDRLIVQTNLIDSYDLLMGFAEKHLLDKFYLEDGVRISLRNNIAREMLINTLIHREFASTYICKFVIEKDKMYTENANRATTGELITPDNFEPNPKNPTVADFFRNIGMADELGSGVRNLYKYGRRYSGQDPQLIDGDIFRIVVPLDDSYSFDAETSQKNKAQIKAQNKAQDCAINCALILDYLRENPTATQKAIAEAIGKSRTTVQNAVKELQDKGFLEREGAKKNGRWIVK